MTVGHNRVEYMQEGVTNDIILFSIWIWTWIFLSEKLRMSISKINSFHVHKIMAIIQSKDMIFRM